jgi:hypothetical protein
MGKDMRFNTDQRIMVFRIPLLPLEQSPAYLGKIHQD